MRHRLPVAESWELLCVFVCLCVCLFVVVVAVAVVVVSVLLFCPIV